MVVVVVVVVVSLSLICSSLFFFVLCSFDQADAFVTLDLLEKHVQPPLDVPVIVPAMALAIVDVVNVKLVLWAAIAIQRN